MIELTAIQKKQPKRKYLTKKERTKQSLSKEKKWIDMNC